MQHSAKNINIWTNPIYFLAFGFGAGKLPFVPGTWGTVMAVPLYLLLVQLPLVYYAIVVVLAFLIGIWICGVTEKAIGIADYSGIVWDEIVGFWLTMLAMPLRWYWILAGFILFRVFDIWKPWPIRWVQQHVHGGLGVMVDDVMAAVYVGIIMHILRIS